MNCKLGSHFFVGVPTPGSLCKCGEMKSEKSELKSKLGMDQVKIVPVHRDLKHVMKRAFVNTYGRERRF